MSVISIRLPENLLLGLDNCAHTLHLHRAEYIRKAIEHMNETVSRHERNQQLKKASLLARQESMKINAEFDQIEQDPEA